MKLKFSTSDSNERHHFHSKDASAVVSAMVSCSYVAAVESAEERERVSARAYWSDDGRANGFCDSSPSVTCESSSRCDVNWLDWTCCPAACQSLGNRTDR
ncbi:hypothetical protein J437_LFUL005526 [Ladona fulva]|uniref:Uncharacterized protein n=1 Tax=Ladona fulva TaxID=123851 RepID=A0A8K0K348_LADFU|nr:hypothetical protein J437_LFUL005526 [Ladona fulva]